MGKRLGEILDGQDNSDEVEIDLSGAVEFVDLEAGFKGRFLVRECTPGISKPKDDGSGENPVLVWKTSVDMPGHEAHDAYGPISSTPTTGKGAGQSKKWLKALGVNVDDPNVRIKPSAQEGKHFIGTIQKQRSNPEYLEFGKIEPDDPNFEG